jgi:hypothetical protein
MAYLGNDLSTIVKQGKIAYKFLATSGQTAFSGNDANGILLELTTNTFVTVFLNGVLLIKTDDYTISTNTLTLVSAATLNDELVIVRDIDNAVFSSYTKTETDTLLNLKASLSDPYFTGASIRVPNGTTAERPGSPAVGMIRYNTTNGVLEQYTTDGWVGIEPAPTITGIVYPGTQTAVWQGDVVTINGTGFKSGVIAKFLNPSTGIVTNADSTTRVSSSQITAVFPTSVSTEATYTVLVTNPSGLGASYDNSLTVDGLPIWGTSSGSIGSFPANASLSYSLVSIEDTTDATMVIISGALPSGVSMNSSGVISGTPADISNDTVYSFTVRATDAENQTSNRSFTMTVTENYQQTTTATFG